MSDNCERYQLGDPALVLEVEREKRRNREAVLTRIRDQQNPQPKNDRYTAMWLDLQNKGKSQ
jgi:hypothetical protein